MLLFFAALEALDPDERNEIEKVYQTTKEKLPFLIAKQIKKKYSDDPELIDDLTQDVYLKVIRYKDRFIGKTEPVIWGNLSMVYRNVCANYMKRAGLIQFVSLDDVKDRLTESDEEPVLFEAAAGDGSMTPLVQTETVDQMKAAIETLGTPYRELIIERYCLETSYAEIAKKYQLKKGSVGPLLRRSLEKLRKELEEYVENHNG